jgi:serine/threonine protein kinase
VGTTRALAALHEKGIAHRDVKPGNIFLDLLHVPISRISGSPTPSRHPIFQSSGRRTL